ncbi:hypothetical protein FC50_GL001860 [Lacticaseibacillus pantheris DSM 15945 = JCM 12539 = NBRC 106106]|uniref:SseB protein N-terminal domain-containing protein n=1 Tax=Lacticaseibacillus pantheris DSM 15945 = JCM 12539 = NBRC 106106 TaxID=1423783 RepID=A0A0R1U101_9LACO|nr:enhanced serine sensitivity protein SseB C-terminal domain-containing protein [Lacticaseibacillus pantheris]KRL85066.1 hypothetical protein FC50_GL001860 [Lacticaseibacillus pantheris DSM 15945 = JCM 12539 = NBRC 106106]
MSNKIETALINLRNTKTEESFRELEDTVMDSTLLLTIQQISEDEIHLVVITNDHDEKYLPVYSDTKNMGLNQQKLNYSEVSFGQLVDLLKQDSTIYGVVIDPYSNNIPFSRDDWFSMQAKKQSVKSGTEISIGKPSADVSELTDGLIELLKKQPKIDSAYLVQSIENENNRSSLLVVVNSDSSGALRAVSDEAGALLSSQETLDFIPQNTGIGKFVAENFVPFYNKDDSLKA